MCQAARIQPAGDAVVICPAQFGEGDAHAWDAVAPHLLWSRDPADHSNGADRPLIARKGKFQSEPGAFFERLIRLNKDSSDA